VDQNCRLKADRQAYPRAVKPVAGEAGTCEVGRLRRVRVGGGEGPAADYQSIAPPGSRMFVAVLDD